LDAKELTPDVELLHIKNLTYFKSTNSKRADIYAVDKHLKSLGILISANERELLKKSTCVIISRKYLINWHNNYIYITPYTSKKTSMTHEFKEKMRLLKIEPKLRPYFFANLDVFESLGTPLSLQ